MRRQNLLAAAGIAVLAGGFQAAANAGATTSGGAKAGAIPATIDSSASPSRVFSASRGGVTFRYRVRGAGPVSVQIRLYRRSGNSLIRTWKRHPKDGGWHTIHWDGSAHGKAQPDGLDAVYAHLKHPSHHPEGSRVYTGQRIGVVGQTGDATACHLHFELWSSPGWYSGGHPFDPAPYLHAWDRYS